MTHTKILFVCMGNICRSPTAEGVFRRLTREHPQLANLIIDSCGTIGHHVGEPPDPRSVEAAKKRHYDLSKIRSRKLVKTDLEYYDLILAMDEENMVNILAISTEEQTAKVKLFLDYSNDTKLSAVPDPYYGGNSGFDGVIDLVEGASRGLIRSLLEKV